MGYEPRPNSPGYWAYDGLEIQADIETHKFAVAFARTQLPPGGRVIDIGAGSGALSKQLLDAGLDVSCTSWDGRVGLPIPVYALDLDHAFGLEAVGGRPYPGVCCLEVIEHIENPSALLRSCRAIVADDGFVLLSTPNVESAQTRLQWLLRGQPRMFTGNEVRRNRHITMLWREGLEFLVERAGFRIESRHMIGGPNIRNPLLRAVKHATYGLMGTVCRGDLQGETRLYVLRPQAAAAAAPGPGQVY